MRKGDKSNFWHFWATKRERERQDVYRNRDDGPTADRQRAKSLMSGGGEGG